MTTLREQNMKYKGSMKKNQRPRSSITDPYEKFWPLLDSENSNVLINEMEKTILREKGKLKINWFTLKKLPLDVKKCQIKENSNKHKLNICPNLKAQRLILKVGINEVTRCMEKGQIACCLIAEDVANSVIVKHLISMTAAMQIPVVILPKLRLVMKCIIGFSSAVLGLKTDILNITESPLYNLYQTVIKLSNKFKNPYPKQIALKKCNSVENPTKLNMNIENYLLKKPREGKAFVPGGTTNIPILNDLSFIPIEKMIVEEQKPFEQDEELIQLPTSTNLFSIDTKPLNVEDIGVSVTRQKHFKQPLRYHGLKMKKMKPNPNRKLQGEKSNIN